MNKRQFDFGQERVSEEYKRRRVNEVFDSASKHYDQMNDVISLGSHRLLKRIAAEFTGLRRGGRALDIAGGTGDLAILLSRITGREGTVTLLDVNEQMIRIGRDRLINAGCDYVDLVLADAVALPLSEDYYDSVTIGFGLRNIVERDEALNEAYRVLKPCGRLVVLEFATPSNPIYSRLFRLLQQTWPIAGRLVFNNRLSYTYLVESITAYPSLAVVSQMLEDAGFREVYCEEFLFGAVTIHIGTK